MDRQENEKGISDSNKRSCEMGIIIIIVLRFMGMSFTLIAAVLGGTDKETQIIPFTLINGLPPLHVSVDAKWHYLSSTVFFVVANAIACTYSVASLVLCMLSKSRGDITALPLLISDLIMAALLFSANGAAAAVGVIAVHGNSRTQWHKVCNMFKKYCHYAAASIVISMLGSFVFLCLVVLGILKLHKKSSR